MIALEMNRSDWERLQAFIRAANDVRSVVRSAVDAGKQQVSVNDAAVKHWLSVDVPPDVWLKLGGLMASSADDDERGT